MLPFFYTVSHCCYNLVGTELSQFRCLCQPYFPEICCEDSKENRGCVSLGYASNLPFFGMVILVSYQRLES